MTSQTVSESGELEIPREMRERYHLTPDTRIRVIETRNGILLVPLTSDPIEPELERELADWQALTAESWAASPYEES